MSYRVQGPNLDKILSATETKSIKCQNKEMGGNVVVSRYTTEPENLVITGPNLSKTNQAGTIKCKDRMMGANIQFAHTAKAQLYVDIDTTEHFSVKYNGVTYPQGHGLYEVERGKTLTVTFDEAFSTSSTTYYNYVYENGEQKIRQFGAGTYTITVPASANAITVATGGWYQPGHSMYSIHILYGSEGMMKVESNYQLGGSYQGMLSIGAGTGGIFHSDHAESLKTYYAPKMNGYVIGERLSSRWEYGQYSNDAIYFNGTWVAGASSGQERSYTYNLPSKYSMLSRVSEGLSPIKYQWTGT